MTPLWLMNIFGWIVMHKRLVLTVVGIVVVLGLIIGVYRGCKDDDPPPLTPEQVQEAQKAIATEDRQKQIEILAKSDAAEAVADQTETNARANTVNAIHESKKKWNEASDEEIRAELERRAKGQ